MGRKNWMIIFGILISILMAGVISAEVNLTRIIPGSFSLGDSQLSIEVQNVGNETVNGLSAFVTGRGFSTYEIIPIDSLGAGDKSYILVFGNFREAGNVSLSISMTNQVFFKEVFVSSPESDEQEKIEAENAQILADVSSQLEGLKNNLSELENQIADKKENNFDVSQINVADLRSYVRNTESSVLSGNADSAKVNMRLALEEYLYQKKKLDNSKEISIFDRLKNNALLFSALAGAIIIFFSLYELLKKQGGNVVSTIGSVKSRIGSKKEEGKKK